MHGGIDVVGELDVDDRFVELFDERDDVGVSLGVLKVV